MYSKTHISSINLESSALTMRVRIIPELSAISADSLCRTLCSSSALSIKLRSLFISIGKSQLERKSSTARYSAKDWMRSPQRSILLHNILTVPSESIWKCSSWSLFRSEENEMLSLPSAGASKSSPMRKFWFNHKATRADRSFILNSTQLGGKGSELGSSSRQYIEKRGSCLVNSNTWNWWLPLCPTKAWNEIFGHWTKH